MADDSAPITVTVLSVAGTEVLGPEAFPKSAQVCEIKARLKEMRAPGEMCFVKLILGSQELFDGNTIADHLDVLADQVQDIAITAIFIKGLLSKDEREQYLKLIGTRGVFRYWEHIPSLSEKARLDHELAFAVLARDKPEAICRDFWRDRDFVLHASSQYGMALLFADRALKADRYLVLVAVGLNGSLLQYVDEKLRADEEIALAAARSERYALLYVDATLRAKAAFVESVVKRDGMALCFADPVLRANADVVRAAVSHNGMALRYADLYLRSNADIVQAAVDQRKDAWGHADHDALCIDKSTGLVSAQPEPGITPPEIKSTWRCDCLYHYIRVLLGLAP